MLNKKIYEKNERKFKFTVPLVILLAQAICNVKHKQITRSKRIIFFSLSIEHTWFTFTFLF